MTENKTSRFNFLFWMEIIICIDIILTFFKAYHGEETNKGIWLTLCKKLKICRNKKKPRPYTSFQQKKSIWQTEFLKVA